MMSTVLLNWSKSRVTIFSCHLFLNMKHHIFLAAALVMSVANLSAQTTTNPAPIKIEVVQEGELRLDGKLTGLLGTTQWTMDSYAFTSPRGVTKEFDEAKSKAIRISPTTHVHPIGEETKIPLKDVKIGSAIAVIGKSGPQNSLIAREIILLEGYGQRKTVGTLNSNPFTGALINQSRKARDMGQRAKSLELAIQGAQGAAGMGDKSGEVLATRDVVLLHLEDGQFQQALDASLRIEKLGREMGNDMVLALGLSGKGNALSGLNKKAEAIKAYEESVPYGLRASSGLAESILNALAMTYLGANQFSNAIQTLEKLAPIEASLGKPIDAAGSRWLIAILRAEDDSAASKAELASGEQLLTNITEPKERSGALLTLGLLNWRLGQKGTADERLTAAQKLYEAQNDSRSAKRMEEIKTYLGQAENKNATIANILLGRINLNNE
jgi:predicted negative regulator of RcsB-dependent stress response